MYAVKGKIWWAGIGTLTYSSEISPKSEFWKDGYCAPYTGKNYGFWLLWGICKEYIKQNIIKAVLRKANAHSVVICRLIKNR